MKPTFSPRCQRLLQVGGRQFRTDYQRCFHNAQGPWAESPARIVQSARDERGDGDTLDDDRVGKDITIYLDFSSGGERTPTADFHVANVSMEDLSGPSQQDSEFSIL
jgi:hypothetical protein